MADYPSDTDRTRSASPPASMYGSVKKSTPNMRINTLLNDEGPASIPPPSKGPGRGNWARNRNGAGKSTSKPKFEPQVWDLELEDLVARDWFDDIVFNPIESNGELDLIPFPLDCFETLPNESIAAKAAPIISELEQILARTGLDQSGWREAEQLQLKILELIRAGVGEDGTA